MQQQEEELPLPSFAEMFGDGFTSVRGRRKRAKARDNEELTGRWTADEHRLFLEGIMLYGRDWKKMQVRQLVFCSRGFGRLLFFARRALLNRGLWCRSAHMLRKYSRKLIILQ